MKRIGYRFCVLGAIALFTLSLTAVSAQDDRPTIGRCINLGNTLEAPVEGEWGFVIAESDLKTIASAGFDSVRIPIRWSVHAAETAPYTIDADFFERIDEVIGWALDAGLQPIINIHHYDAMIAEPAEHRERFMALWRQIAERYIDQPSSLVFELLNEPNGNLSDYLWNRYHRDSLAIIHEIDPDRTVMIGGTGWNSAWNLYNLLLPEDHDYLIATFHNYEPFQFTHQGAEWVDGSNQWLGKTWGTDYDYRQLQELFDLVAKWQEDRDGIPVVMGEFGAYSKADQESRLLWTRAAVEEAEERAFGWCYWEFAAGFGIYNRTTQEFNSLYEALIPADDVS